MRRLTLLGLFLVTGLFASGCGKQEEAKPRAEPEAIVAVEQKKEEVSDPAADSPAADSKPFADSDASFKKEKYDATLLEALNLIADHKLAAALLKMRDAKDALDTAEIKQEIDNLQKRIDQQEAAQTTTQAIQTVLASGSAQDATTLATAGLQQFGGGDNAEELAKLKRQADALAASNTQTPEEHRKQLLAEAKAACDDKNLRAAAIAYEEALQLQDDADIRKELEGLHTALNTYDDCLRRAVELRKDPANLEQALAALKDAQAAWDTLQIRQEIDNYTLALQKRKDRLSVADFEVWGDVGLPEPGKRFAEELLPAFKSRFDLVEREQIAKVISELKLEQNDLLTNDSGRQELGRLAKVRFLVLGSISSKAGITINARLVDVQTGLIVQTAKLAAATPEDLIAKLPDLANMLMMTDEQKLAREQELAKEAVTAEVKPIAVAAIPPAPAAPAVNDKPPAPIVMFNARPPALGGIQIGDFNQFQPAPAGALVPPNFAVVDPVRQRLFFLAIELGDNLFRRGRFREAQFQYTLALNLIPNSPDVLLRLDNLAPFLPPGSVINPLIPIGPTLGGGMAVFNFAAIGDPVFERSGFGSWIADNLAPYFSPPFVVVDRGTVNFYMSRLGLSLRDVLRDPFTRQWLGRAMNVRYFLFGTVVQGPRAFNRTLEVKTHLIDVEFGFEVGSGDIVTFSPSEMRMRFAELAQLTLLPADQRLVFARENQDARQLLLDAKVRLGNGEFEIALDLFRKLRHRQPNNVEAAVLFQQANQQAQAAAFDAGRRQQLLQDQLLLSQAQQQQMALAQQAEAQRVAAAQQAAALGIANQQVRQAQRDRAYERLLAQALAAQKQNNVNVTVQVLESAVALKPNDDGFRQLAMARAKADELARRRTAEAQAAQEKSLRQQREAELAQAKAQLDLERKTRADAEAKLSEARLARDQAAYQQFVDNAKTFVTKQQFDQAIAALQTAQQLRQTGEVKALLANALAAQTQANLATKDAAERAKLEQQLKTEKERRAKAEAEAKRNADLYTQALKLAQDALAQQKFDQAITKFQDAGKIYQTDVVLTGLKSAQDGKAKQQELTNAALRKPVEERKREDDFKTAMTQGKSALDAGQFDKAMIAFKQATTLKPDNVDALAALAKAQQATNDAVAKAAQAEAQIRLQADAKKVFESLIKSGRDLLASKQYDGAIKAFTDAGKLMPSDASVSTLLQQAQKGKADAAIQAADAASKQKLQKMLADVRAATVAGKFDQATKALADAQQFAPQDPAVMQAGKDLDTARTTAATEKTNKQMASKLVGDAQAALKAGNLDAAEKALADAKKLTPQDPTLVQAAKDLDQARAMAAKETDQKRKLDSYKRAMDTGRQSMTGKKYDDAIAAFTAAGNLMPGDKDAAAMLTLATSKAKEMAAEATSQKQLQKLLGDFQTALKASQLDLAGKVLVDAKKLAPQDPAVIQGVKDLESARTLAANETMRKQKLADYQKALTAGRDALAAKKFDEAIKDFTQAGTLVPGDKDAAALLKQAEKAKADARTTTDLDSKKKAEFTRLMDQGQKLLSAKRYTDAANAYQDALDLMPDNAAAKAGLQKAKKAAETVKPAANTVPAEYTRQMQLGAALDKQQRYADAVRAYAAALKAVPNDAKASSAQGFSQHMADGVKQLTSRKFADAAKEFDEALKVNADDATAKSLLKKAREGK